MPKLIAKEHIHSCYTKHNTGDAVIVKTHEYYDDGTVRPGLDIIQDPKRSFYISKKGIQQTHKYKKEWEELKNLDRYDCYNYELESKIYEVLNGYPSRRYQSLASLCDSPYIYGADVHIESLIKQKYITNFEKTGAKPTAITTGLLDIETDIVNGNGTDPIVISVTHENKVFTAILESFFVLRDGNGGRTNCTLEELKVLCNSVLKEHIDKHNFTFEYYIGKTYIDLVRWIFQKIHENKTDFLGIWNLDFDIPKIMDVIKDNNIPYEDIMCHPSIPKHLRKVNYIRDNSKNVEHITKKWHWLECTGYSQFVDSMCLYSILRTAKGKETSYSLDNILKVNKISDGKLKFKDDPNLANLSSTDWHRYMQKYKPYEYIIYNQFDCMSIQLMEWKTNDLTTMAALGGITRLSKWPRQTRKVADSFYTYCLGKGLVTASAGTNMMTEFDQLVGKVGGAVLRPERTRGAGLHIFSDMPYLETMLHGFVSDVDFSAQYPTCSDILNQSRETKLFTALDIDSHVRTSTQRYFSLITSIPDNATFICNDYYSLPNYEQIDELFTSLL